MRNSAANVLRSILVALALAMMAASANATIINPAPGLFGPDDGTELFAHAQFVLSIDNIDPAGSLEFGFYFQGDSANRHSIFDPLDSVGDQALINFALGFVVDVETTLPQSSFTPSVDPIGFYVTVGSPTAGFTTFYSEASLNAGGIDRAATFPRIGNPNQYLIGFEGPPGIGTLSFDIVSHVRPIPEPAGLALVLIGLGVLAGRFGGRTADAPLALRSA